MRNVLLPIKTVEQCQKDGFWWSGSACFTNKPCPVSQVARIGRAAAVGVFGGGLSYVVQRNVAYAAAWGLAMAALSYSFSTDTKMVQPGMPCP